MRKLITGAVGGIATLLTLATAVYANGYNYTYDLSDVTASSAGTAVAGTVGLVVWCCIILFAFLVPVVLAIVVYKDAEKNKVENAIIWALLTFFFNVIGLLVYFLAIRPEAMKKNGGGSTSTPSAS